MKISGSKTQDLTALKTSNLELQTSNQLMKHPHHNSTLIILILGSLATVSPFSIDMSLPAFSQIADDFGTTPARISFSVTSYFIGLAIGQMIYGPLLDRFWTEKTIVRWSYNFSSLHALGVCRPKASELLMALQFLPTLGGCVAWVAALAMVRDFFPVEQSARVFSLLILVIGLSPLLAPTLGGFIATGLGWRWVFIVLALIVFLILMVTIFFLPEGHKPDTTVSFKGEANVAHVLFDNKEPSVLHV